MVRYILSDRFFFCKAGSGAQSAVTAKKLGWLHFNKAERSQRAQTTTWQHIQDKTEGTRNNVDSSWVSGRCQPSSIS